MKSFDSFSVMILFGFTNSGRTFSNKVLVSGESLLFGIVTGKFTERPTFQNTLLRPKIVQLSQNGFGQTKNWSRASKTRPVASGKIGPSMARVSKIRQ